MNIFNFRLPFRTTLQVTLVCTGFLFQLILYRQIPISRINQKHIVLVSFDKSLRGTIQIIIEITVRKDSYLLIKQLARSIQII